MTRPVIFFATVLSIGACLIVWVAYALVASSDYRIHSLISFSAYLIIYTVLLAIKQFRCYVRVHNETDLIREDDGNVIYDKCIRCGYKDNFMDSEETY